MKYISSEPFLLINNLYFRFSFLFSSFLLSLFSCNENDEMSNQVRVTGTMKNL